MRSSVASVAWRAEMRHQMRPGAADAARIDVVDAEIEDGSTWLPARACVSRLMLAYGANGKPSPSLRHYGERMSVTRHTDLDEEKA